MPPSHLTLASLEVGFKNTTLTLSTLFSHELANDVAWFKTGGFKPQARTLPCT